MRRLGFALLLASAAALISFSIWLTPRPELPDRLVYEIASFDELPGWGQTDREAARRSFLVTCHRVFHADAALHTANITARRTIEDTPAGGVLSLYGDTTDWQDACEAALYPAGASFFQDHFTPIRIRNNSRNEGLFTGYYEPQLRGSRTQSEEYSTPLLARPDDLVMVQLSEFPGEHSGRIAGRVENGQLKPFEDRSSIEAGALGNAEPIVWIDDAVDAFFLHIQGSGRVVLEDGSVVRVGYAGQNGHPYTSIGRILVQQGAITQEEASMQSIRAWLSEHPDEGRDIMQANASYIFFREIDVDDPDQGPIGAANVPLTPGYSLAVDRTYHALGAPVYVSTELPDGTPFQRLMVAQDTGGAIRGPVRGDIFFGFGHDAGEIAGAMRSQGEMWVLVPNAVAERIATEQAAE